MKTSMPVWRRPPRRISAWSETAVGYGKCQFSSGTFAVLTSPDSSELGRRAWEYTVCAVVGDFMPAMQLASFENAWLVRRVVLHPPSCQTASPTSAPSDHTLYPKHENLASKVGRGPKSCEWTCDEQNLEYVFKARSSPAAASCVLTCYLLAEKTGQLSTSPGAVILKCLLAG